MTIAQYTVNEALQRKWHANKKVKYTHTIKKWLAIKIRITSKKSRRYFNDRDHGTYRYECGETFMYQGVLYCVCSRKHGTERNWGMDALWPEFLLHASHAALQDQINQNKSLLLSKSLKLFFQTTVKHYFRKWKLRDLCLKPLFLNHCNAFTLTLIL
jgi:uncharacterized circularly permuted ATP-grasp superfamily protein